MRRPQYTRYALRLEPSAGARPPAAPAPAPGPPHADPDDDWSGTAAYAARPDEQALDYADPRAVAELVALQPAGWQEDEGGRTLVFWLEDGAEADAGVAAALRRIGALGRLEVSRERPGWEDAWRRFHKPHVIGRLYVRPPWCPARDDLLDIVVEAGLAFGTGGHASTRQCLELIQTIARCSLLDLGSGSGVVSFAALRLGFSPVCGIDIDPVAVHAAAGNAALNDLAPTSPGRRRDRPFVSAAGGGPGRRQHRPAPDPAPGGALADDRRRTRRDHVARPAPALRAPGRAGR